MLDILLKWLFSDYKRNSAIHLPARVAVINRSVSIFCEPRLPAALFASQLVTDSSKHSLLFCNNPNPEQRN